MKNSLLADSPICPEARIPAARKLESRDASYEVLGTTPGCASSVNGTVGTITFKSGTLGATFGNLNSLMASMLTAYTSGRAVMVFYDTVTGCPGELIANGGYSGQCP